MIALRLEEDGWRVLPRTWIRDFTPEVSDWVATVTAAWLQIQTTRTAFHRTWLVCRQTSRQWYDWWCREQEGQRVIVTFTLGFNDDNVLEDTKTCALFYNSARVWSALILTRRKSLTTFAKILYCFYLRFRFLKHKQALRNLLQCSV